ncbi:MAG: TIGR04282 family arsenosugar biosynthesis glycosyltransferase [Pirellulaceae bacterium]|nr:TIGR04282 family arsenosugar biosynthesis glycosyltransferase [Pirellulaceae bacterium]
MDELVVFAKYWQPGRVKTRLGVEIGMDASSEIYRQFLVTLLNRLQTEGDQRILAFAPSEHRRDFEKLPGAAAWKLTPQSSGNLGDRLSRLFQQRFQAGASRVVLIGSDSPSLPLQYVRDAFRHLQTHDAVLGPSTDGGYYLVGMQKPLGFLFERIDWSTEKVWRQTLQRIESNPTEISLAVLPQWYDIDTLEGLQQLVDELDQSKPDSEATRVLSQLCHQLLIRGKR